jgi:hypothetical protein
MDPTENYNVQEVVNKNLKPLEVTLFQDYLETLKPTEKVRIIVGRGQLSARSEIENIPTFSEKPIRPGLKLYSVDIDPKTIPDLVADITNIEHMAAIPNGCVDEFIFDGVTYPEVYKLELLKMFRQKLKVGGRFITNYTIWFNSLFECALGLQRYTPRAKLSESDDYFVPSDGQFVFYQKTK